MVGDDAVDLSFESHVDRLLLEPTVLVPELGSRYGRSSLRDILLEVGQLQGQLVRLVARTAEIVDDVPPDEQAALIKRLRGHVLKADGRFNRLHHLVSRLMPSRLRDALDTLELSVRLSAEGSVGQGTPTPVPWCRVYSDDIVDNSRSATTGYYLVYLFADDGDSVALSLNQGTDSITTQQIAARVDRARGYLTAENLSALEEHITLLSVPPPVPSARAKHYQQGNIAAITYALSDVELPTESELLGDLERLAKLQQRIYLAEREHLVADPSVMHILMKWADLTDHTMTAHQTIAKSRGTVWWGNFTDRSTSVGDDKVGKVDEQLAEGVATHVYFHRGTPPQAWVADLSEFTTSVDDVDDRLPSYYDGSSHNAFVLVSNFREIDPSSMTEKLALWSNPAPGSLTKRGLGNSTSPMYVVELDRPPAARAAPRASSIDALAEQTGWTRDRLEEAIRTLTGPKPQIILAGPPGTGKTWVAKALAAYLTDGIEACLKLVQFHPTYGYEEFIEGLRPGISKTTGAIEFAEQPGTLRTFAVGAESGRRHVMVLDEVNRANLPRVLGELMYALEYRDEPVDLLYTKAFRLPEALSFIGTMNTADRSIRSIDIALRRRFEIFECPPNSELLTRYYEDPARTLTAHGLEAGLERLNERLEAELDRHHTIGHSFFMTESFTRADLERVWERQIAPLIEEYFFDQPDLAAEFRLDDFWPTPASD